MARAEPRNLRDCLAHLSYRDVVKLVGPAADAMLRAGGRHEIDIARQVSLDGTRFVLDLDEASVTISRTDAAPRGLTWTCSTCETFCEHVGAAFSLVLEEKLALGLAAPPRERIPVEGLSEEALVRQAIAQREERSRIERMTVTPQSPGVLWADYLVGSDASGKTYRVALRGWERGEAYCSCPDFRTNTLGTCKHILHVGRKMRRQFPVADRRTPFAQPGFAVHLRYGPRVELRLLAPPRVSRPLLAIVAPALNRAITDVHALLGAVRHLEQAGQAVTIYPDAEEYIQQWLFGERMAARVAEIRRNPRAHPLRRTLLKAELLPYQLDGIAFAAGAGRAILADDMGLGKTIQGIGVAELLAMEAGITRVLIVCPVSLKSQWRSEIQRFSGRGCQLVSGSAPERASQYANPGFFTICNYEQVVRDIVWIEKTRWDLVVLDEGQRIKNWEAKTSRVVKRLRSPFALVLSGTPLENRLDDLYSVVSFIDDRRLGPAFRFFNTFRTVDQNGRVLGYKNLDQLRKWLEPMLLRRTRAMVMKDLPPRSTEIIRITPTSQQADIHDGQKRIISQIVRKAYISEMDLLRLQEALLMCRMVANGTFLVDKQYPGYSSKLEELRGLIRELGAEEDRKVILFSEWTTMLDAIEPVLKEQGLHFVRLDGSVPQKLRAGLVREFQEERNCRFFLATNAGSTGLNLQAANTVLNVDLPWNPAVLEQRVGRAHRMGQKRPVQVYLLVTENTIEESLLGTLAAKHELALAALDPDSDVSEVNLVSGIEELKARLEQLLGQKPPAPVDETGKATEADAAARLARQEKVAAAGGQLLNAAFAFLNELLPPRPETAASAPAAALIQDRLSQCLETDATGHLRLSVTLPDAGALQALAKNLATLLDLK